MYSKASETPTNLSEHSALPEPSPPDLLHATDPVDQILVLVGGQLPSLLLMLAGVATASSPASPFPPLALWAMGATFVACYALWVFWLLRYTLRPSLSAAPQRAGPSVLMGLSAAYGLAWAGMVVLVFMHAPGASTDALTWLLLISLLLSSHYHAHGILQRPAWTLLALQSAALAGAWLVFGDYPPAALAAAAVLVALALSCALARLRAREHARVQRGISDRLEERTCLMQQMSHLQDVHASKSRLLAMVSHDLRQPVHALGLMLGRFRQDPSSSSLRIEIEAVNDVVNSLSKSLTMLMAVTRLNSGQVIALPEPVSLERLFSSLANEFEEIAEASRLQLRFKSSDLNVTTDPNHLRTILANLISNAIKYTPQGGVKVAARMADPDTVSIEIRDSGIGIPSHEMCRIFEPFVRLNFRKTSADGIGLGLAIVKQTADLIKATIQVESEVGLGTTFTIALPLSQQAPTAGAPMPNTYLRGLRVVVIDNDETVLESMARTLEEWGCRVIAASGWDELDVKLSMTVSPIDLILTDFHLDAGFSGYELIQRLRKKHQSQIPAILLTGDVEIRHGHGSTGNAVVIAYKPLPREKLALLIHDTVSSHAAKHL